MLKVILFNFFQILLGSNDILTFRNSGDPNELHSYLSTLGEEIHVKVDGLSCQYYYHISSGCTIVYQYYGYFECGNYSHFYSSKKRNINAQTHIFFNNNIINVMYGYLATLNEARLRGK